MSEGIRLLALQVKNAELSALKQEEHDLLVSLGRDGTIAEVWYHMLDA